MSAIGASVESRVQFWSVTPRDRTHAEFFLNDGSLGMLQIDGQVGKSLQLTDVDLAGLPAEFQIDDVRQHGAKRPGRAVRLGPVLQLAKVDPKASHIGLHAERDNFHASIPLAPILDRAMIIYQNGGAALSVEAGGPFRFWIPDHAACQADEIDECANVKFIDRIELTIGKGIDNRPKDDDEHARLHEAS